MFGHDVLCRNLAVPAWCTVLCLRAQPKGGHTVKPA